MSSVFHTPDAPPYQSIFINSSPDRNYGRKDAPYSLPPPVHDTKSYSMSVMHFLETSDHATYRSDPPSKGDDE